MIPAALAPPRIDAVVPLIATVPPATPIAALLLPPWMLLVVASTVVLPAVALIPNPPAPPRIDAVVPPTVTLPPETVTALLPVPVWLPWMLLVVLLRLRTPVPELLIAAAFDPPRIVSDVSVRVTVPLATLIAG